MPQPHAIADQQLPDGHRRGLSRHEPRHPEAANIAQPSDAELLDILARALRGDAHPASGRNRARAASAASLPLTSVIEDILRGEPPAARIEASTADFVMPDVELEWEPITAQQLDVQLTPSVPVVAAPGAAPRRYAFGLSSIAFVLGLSIAGASLPAWLAGPPRYMAETRLQMQAESASQPGLLDVFAARLSSPHLLSQVVAKLKLDRDAEFTGGKATAIGVVLDLFAGNGGASDAPSRAQAKLRDDLKVAADARTGALRLSIVSGDAAKSARIANLLADIAVFDAAVSQNATASGRGTAALDAASRAYDQAVAALAAFRSDVGEDKIKAALDLQQQRKDVDAETSAAADAVQAAQIRLTAARSAKLTDVLDGSLSPDLGSPAALDDLRNRYATARSTLSQLSAQLGPRHPRLLAQQATIDDLRTTIQSELQRLVAADDSLFKRALTDRKALAAKAAALAGQTVGVDMVHLDQLQAAIEAARSDYDATLKGVDAAKPAPVAVPLALSQPAVAPTLPIDDNLAAAEATGFFLGLGIALCLVFLRAWVANALLRDETNPSEVALDPSSDARLAEPILLADRPAIAPPEQRFDASIPVANDWLFSDGGALPPAASANADLAILQDGMASLRAKVESYALQRRAASR